MPHDVGPGEPDRDEVIGRLYEQLAVITRRASVRERTGDSPLTLVDHGLLELVRTWPGVSAAELARLLGLNRSTTSRQIAALARAGLLQRTEARGGSFVLEPTPAGLRALETSRAAHLAALESRLRGWGADRIGRRGAARGELTAGEESAPGLDTEAGPG
jgi:DNA-binding MarR family transcriptional regulator